MKILIIRKKNIGMVAIILGLIILLFSFSKILNSRLINASFTLNSIEKLKKIEVLKGKSCFYLPENWIYKEEGGLGKEVLYSGEFKSEDNKIGGLFQIWNTNKDIYKFLKDSENISKEQNKIFNYSINNIKIGNKEVILVKYKIENKNGEKYLAYEYFIPKGREVTRMSFFLEEKNYKEYFGGLFEALVNNICFNQ